MCAKHPLSKRKHRNINVRLRASTLSCQARPTKGAFCVPKHLLEKKTHRIMTVRLRALTFSRYARRTENLFVRKGPSSKNFFVFGLTTRSHRRSVAAMCLRCCVSLRSSAHKNIFLPPRHSFNITSASTWFLVLYIDGFHESSYMEDVRVPCAEHILHI